MARRFTRTLTDETGAATVAWLERLARRLAHDDADDLVQDAFEAAQRAGQPSDAPRRAWLAGILRNVHARGRRRDARRHAREVHLIDEPMDERPPADERLAVAESLRALLDELEGLREPYRGTLHLLYFEELSAVETARRLGVPPETVRKRHQLGLARLRERLDERHHGDRRRWRGLFLLLGSDRAGVVGNRRPAAWGLTAVAVGALVVVLRPTAQTPEGHTASARLGWTAAPTLAGGRSTRARGLAHGTEEACPDLAALVRAAPAGSEVWVPACAHRRAIEIDKPLTLKGQPGAELLGSDVETTFARVERGWRAATPLAPGALVGPNLVFVDGTPAELAEGRSGTDERRRQQGGSPTFEVQDAHVVLHDDPDGHVVEIARRPFWLRVTSPRVRVDALVMRHALNHDRDGALFVAANASGFTLTGSVAGWTQGTVIELRGDGHLVRGNVIEGGGASGVFLNVARATRIERNVIRRNRRVPLQEGARHWVSGGIFALPLRDAATALRPPKVPFEHLTIADNDVLENGGTGIWCQSCDRTAVVGNVVIGNQGPAIALFDNERAEVAFNDLEWSDAQSPTPWSAVHVSGSRASSVHDNTVAEHAVAVLVEPPRAGDVAADFDTCRASRDNAVFDNLLWGPRAETALALRGDPRGASGTIPPCPGQRAHGNRILP